MKQKTVNCVFVEVLEVLQKLLMILHDIRFENLGLVISFLLNRSTNDADDLVDLSTWFWSNHVVEIIATSNIKYMTYFSPIL